MQRLQPLQNPHFGSKIKIPKNSSKSILQMIQSCFVKKTAKKKSKYLRNESILKIGHHEKALAKSSLWDKNRHFLLQQHRFRSNYETFGFMCHSFYTYFYTRANFVGTKIVISICGNIIFGAIMKRRKLNLQKYDAMMYFVQGSSTISQRQTKTLQNYLKVIFNINTRNSVHQSCPRF